MKITIELSEKEISEAIAAYVSSVSNIDIGDDQTIMIDFEGTLTPLFEITKSIIINPS